MEKRKKKSLLFSTLVKPNRICFVLLSYYYSYRTDSGNVLNFITQKIKSSFEYTFWRKTTDLLKIMNRSNCCNRFFWRRRMDGGKRFC